MTCPPEQCDPEALVCWEQGEPLYWPVREVTPTTASGSELRGISIQAASDVFAQALAAWTGVECGDGPPSISVAPMRIDASAAPTSDGEEDDGTDGVNSLYFFDRAWPHEPSQIALTTTTFSVSSGRIMESDIEVNSADIPITIGDEDAVVDLLSVLTHEAGHFFGLSHVYDHGPTMFVAYTDTGDLEPRSLEADDIAGMCAIYPRDRFDDEDGGCGCRLSAGDRRSGASWLAIAAIGAAGLGRRRIRSASGARAPAA